MTSQNTKVDTDSAGAPDKGVGCGALVSTPAHIAKSNAEAQEWADAMEERAIQLAKKVIAVKRQLKDAQDMLSGALNEGEPTKLHVTAHAVRDNLRTALAQLC